MEKEFMNRARMEEKIRTILKGCIENPEEYEDLIEDEAFRLSNNFCRDMRTYCQMIDTHIAGNFCDIRNDWNHCPEFIPSDVKPWGRFDDVVSSIVNGTISDEDLAKFQQWAEDWFFTAFGTYGIAYNFQNLVAAVEYEDDIE